MTPRVSIVVPLYNRCDLTLACLQAIETATPAHLYEVVIVDNASTDATGELLDALEGDVTVIRNATNLGFAKACNQGADAARGEVVFFLNNDTEVRPGWLEAVLATLDAEPGVGATGSLLLYPDGLVQHAGVLLVENELTGFLEVHHRCHRYAGDAPEARAAYEPQAVTGAAIAVRTEAFRAAGGFDEAYWNGYEDIDLCLRLGAAGWRIAFVPTSEIVHHESASGNERYTGMAEGEVRFTERWRGRIALDAIRGVDGARPAPPVAPGNPEQELIAALTRLAQRTMRQHGEPVRLAGRDAELVLERLLGERSLLPA